MTARRSEGGQKMIAKALFKRDLKISWKLWLVVTVVMALLLFALFFATSGMDGSGAMVIQQFYTLFAALIPVFFIGTTGTKLIAARWITALFPM